MQKSNKQMDGGFLPPRNASPSKVCKPKLWVSMERALLLCGIALLAFYGAARIEAILRSRAAVKAFDKFDRAAIARELDSGEASGSPEPGFTRRDDHRVPAHKRSLSQQTGRPLALLRIPKIRLKVPVFDGTDELTLNHAVGRIAGTARPGEPGNIGIAGHRDGFFRELKDIALGDTIELQTPEGVDSYAVERVSIVSPTDVTALRPRSVPSLTLVTCYPFDFIGSAPMRYIVTTSLIRETRGEAGGLTPGLPSKTGNSTRRTK